MNLDGLEVLVYGFGFLIIAAFGVWMASIMAIFIAKNPVIKTLAIMLNLLILSVVILAVIDNAGEQAYEESRYQENDKELLIDGIRIPAGSRLVVEPQMGIRRSLIFLPSPASNIFIRLIGRALPLVRWNVLSVSTMDIMRRL